MKIKNVLMLVLFSWVCGLVALYPQRRNVVSDTLITVKGTITDEAGKRVRGVNVISKCTKRSSIYDTAAMEVTNARGQFSIRVPQNDTLSIGSLEYHRQLIPVDGRTKIDVTLVKHEKKAIIIAGSVKDEDGNPLGGIRVSPQSEGESEEKSRKQFSAVTHRAGHFYCGARGLVALIFHHPEYETQVVPVVEGEDVHVVMQKKK